MATTSARPLRLTRQEALAVYVRATELAATPGMPGAPALTARWPSCARPWARRPSAMRWGSPRRRRAAPPFLDAVRTAAQDRQRLRSPTRPRARRAHGTPNRPGGGVRQLGPVVRGRLGRRSRRRASAARGQDRRGATLGGAIRARRGLGGPVARCTRLGRRTSGSAFASAREARWVAEYYVATDPVEEDDGNLVVTLPTGQVTWAARLLLRLGPDADVSGPRCRARRGSRAGPGDAGPVSGLYRLRRPPAYPPRKTRPFRLKPLRMPADVCG